MKFLKKLTPRVIIGYGLMVLLIMSCVYLDGIGYEENLTAGEDTVFTMDVSVQCQEPDGCIGERLIISMLVPNSWETEENTTITYTSSIDDATVGMTLVPESVLPLNGGGSTWSEHLKNTLGVGPNVLNDMKWVTFQGNEVYNFVQNEEASASVTITTKVGDKNLRAKIGLFVNNSGDGLSSDDRRWKVEYTDCIEVTGGEGFPIDYCELHFNAAQPLVATKNDFITFKFQGNIQDNALDAVNEVHFCSTAYTTGGNSYTVCDLMDNTKMMPVENTGGNYSTTIWPADYYGVSDGEELDYIEYTFKDASGTIEITEDNGDPFLYYFDCN
ncbi:DUF4961 domain-containing protein [Mesonia sp.]|uniref:DUF4961 domain-containing protein n=1 Tax=Mesonia sp. TaxID=1960830 RepID=UPI00177548B3|nr:DUF4961 domain-containing protein [Mesonia sp.]HIB38532.1 DUF4961 domain-containing protein [Mesonia sp.]